MAEEIVCPVCETVNAASNETCVECGADLSSQMPVDHDDPSVADTPPGGSAYAEDEVDFEEAEEYAAQDFHEEPGDVEIEGSPSEQFVNAEEDDDFDEDEFAEFGDSADVDEGEFPMDDEEFGDEDDLYEEGATEQEMEPLGVAEGEESVGDELAQEAADEYVEDEFDEFEDSDDPYDEFEGDEFEDDEQEDSDFEELADEASEELEQDEFAEFEEESPDVDDEFAEFDEDSDFEDLADEASEELEEQDEFAEFQDEADEFEEEALAEPSEPEPEEPPELAVILNPQREGAEDLADLPKPGPYDEPATLTLFADRQHVGDLAVSANILTLGLPQAADIAEEAADEAVEDTPEIEEPYEDPGTMELEDELIEEVEPDPLDDDELYSEDISLQGGGEAPAEAELKEDVDDEFADFEDEASEASEVSEAEMSEASEVSEVEDTGAPVLVDLGQYAESDAFAGKHSYIFRQNKNYTLYVTSDAGTQLNDEMLTLGEHRELEDGDVIVLGGTLAMKFSLPA